MAFVRNLVLFFVGFLPAVAVASMILSAALGDRVESPPEWDPGWNPILWLIMTAPWLLPAVVVVPVLHVLGKRAVDRWSRPVARRLLLGAAPVVFALTVLILWGRENFRLEFVLPVVVAGLLYGALQRLPERRLREEPAPPV